MARVATSGKPKIRFEGMDDVDGGVVRKGEVTDGDAVFENEHR